MLFGCFLSANVYIHSKPSCCVIVTSLRKHAKGGNITLQLRPHVKTRIMGSKNTRYLIIYNQQLTIMKTFVFVVGVCG